MHLKHQGYEILCAADGNTGMEMAFDERPELIILDLMLPGINGLEILSELREQGEELPILILSARSSTENKVEGLRLGADDYLSKPFELSELLARVQALLRRHQTRQREMQIRFSEVEIDCAAQRLRVHGEEIACSKRELELLCLLAGAPGHLFRRDEILRRIWGWRFEGTARTVDNFIRGLRLKIEPQPSKPRHIKTVRGLGYRFER